ncbi:hypothetical protein D3C86_1878510 [compost metagenome]
MTFFVSSGVLRFNPTAYLAAKTFFTLASISIHDNRPRCMAVLIPATVAGMLSGFNRISFPAISDFTADSVEEKLPFAAFMFKSSVITNPLKPIWFFSNVEHKL